MESSPESLPLLPPPEPGRFTAQGLLLTLLVAPGFGLIWAWAAEGVQWYFAPMILFPLLLGVLAGSSVVGLVRFARIGHRPTILLAALLAAVVAGTGQHYFSYLADYRGAGSSIGAGAAPGQNVAQPPSAMMDVAALVREMRPSFAQYMSAQAKRGRPLVQGYVAKGWAAWMTWAVDVLLMIAAATTITLPAMRAPYCNRCGTWYRSVRGGKIDAPTALRLAKLTGVSVSDHPRSFRYRLSACHGGCGPTGCELSWEDAGGAIDLVESWLDAAGRNQVVAILDETGSDQSASQVISEE